MYVALIRAYSIFAPGSLFMEYLYMACSVSSASYNYASYCYSHSYKVIKYTMTPSRGLQQLFIQSLHIFYFYKIETEKLRYFRMENQRRVLAVSSEPNELCRPNGDKIADYLHSGSESIKIIKEERERGWRTN